MGALLLRLLLRFRVVAILVALVVHVFGKQLNKITNAALMIEYCEHLVSDHRVRCGPCVMPSAHADRDETLPRGLLIRFVIPSATI